MMTSPAAQTTWAVGAASVTGPSHAANNIPCQDSAAVRVSSDRLVAVVCDGAGSSKKAHIGARLASEAVADYMASVLAEIDPSDPLSLRPEAEQAVKEARSRIAATLERGETRHDYNATLVAIVGNSRGSAFFHIGDGLALASIPAHLHDGEGNPRINYWALTGVSLPDNGEYANETFFLTQHGWRERLRITPLRRVPELAVLLSDGPEDLVMQDGRPNSAFIDVVVHQCSHMPTGADRDAYLTKVLASSRADPITSDDKTLIIARRCPEAPDVSGDPRPLTDYCDITLGMEGDHDAPRDKHSRV